MKKILKHKKLLITLVTIFSTFVFIFGAFGIYVSIYYHAKVTAKQALVSDDYVTVTKNKNYYVFGNDKASIGLIFYPGAKVEYTSYAPLMRELAKNGIFCALVHMPLNFAFFDIDAAKKIKDKYDGIDIWYLGGHSLGGAMASSYIASNIDDYSGLLLLGSYSSSDLSKTNLNVISIYGSNDRVLNLDKYQSSKKNYPSSFNELIIIGGCHSYFADYGHQRGDGDATISREEQIKITCLYFVDKANIKLQNNRNF